MTELSNTILNECREEVAEEYHCENWKEFTSRHRDTNIAQEKSVELALDRQAEFFRWASSHKWRHDDPFMDGGYWYKNSGVYRGKRFTELELYNIWREGK